MEVCSIIARRSADRVSKKTKASAGCRIEEERRAGGARAGTQARSGRRGDLSELKTPRSVLTTAGRDGPEKRHRTRFRR